MRPTSDCFLPLKPTTCSFLCYWPSKEIFLEYISPQGLCDKLGLTTVSSFLTSSTARSSFSFARFSESSTVISTCSSSFKCSQFGFPRFCSSCKNQISKIHLVARASMGLVRAFYWRASIWWLEPSIHQLDWISSDKFGGWWHHNHRVWSLDYSTSSPCSVNCFLMEISAAVYGTVVVGLCWKYLQHLINCVCCLHSPLYANSVRQWVSFGLANQSIWYGTIICFITHQYWESLL